MYASPNSFNATYTPAAPRLAGVGAPVTPQPGLTPAAARPTPVSSQVYGQDAFVPSSAYASRNTAAAYPSSSSYAAAPTLPPILRLEDIPGTPERMKALSKQVMAPYFEGITWALRNDPEVSMALTYGFQTDEQKLRLVERVKDIVSNLYNLPPITTQVLDEPWVGGGYSFDDNYLYSITTGLLKDATPGDLIYLTVHEMTHAFQHRMVKFPIAPGGDLGELTEFWRGNTPQSHGYVSYTGESNFELYAEQPLEFSAFLGGNFVEYQLTGGNARLWGSNETEATDLYA